MLYHPQNILESQRCIYFAKAVSLSEKSKVPLAYDSSLNHNFVANVIFFD